MGLGRNPALGVCAVNAEEEISSHARAPIMIRFTLGLRLKMVDWLRVWRLAM
jgi:hypothetical protein